MAKSKLSKRKKPKTRNKFEKSVEDVLKRAKVPYEYETEKLPYCIERLYIPDFIIKHSDGSKTYIECKGYLRPEHKAKMASVKKLHPHLDIKILFYSYNPKYVRWAEKHKFPWAIYDIPQEWLQCPVKLSSAQSPSVL